MRHYHGLNNGIAGLCHRRADALQERSERLLLLALLLWVAVVYAALAVSLNGQRGFWSADSGVRFRMVQNWIETGDMAHACPESRLPDPAGNLHPLGRLGPEDPLHGWLAPGPRGLGALYPPLFPLLTGCAYRLFGYGGLTLLPMLAGLGALLLTWAAARRAGLRSALLLIPVMGFATPLALYSVVYWDHSAHMLLAAAAALGMARAARGEPVRGAAWTGAALGLGLWLHELFVVLFVAVLAASLPFARRREGRRLQAALAVGFLLPALLWVACNQWLYGHPGGPHMTGVQAAVGRSQAVREEADWRVRAGIQLFGQARLAAVAPLWLPALALFAAVGGRRGGWRRALPPACLAAAWIARNELLQTEWAHGLLQATPLLCAAAGAPLWDRPRKTSPATPSGRVLSGMEDSGPEPASAVFFPWTARTAWLFTAGVLMVPILPQMDWGSRYLLAALPFYLLLAFYTLEAGVSASGRIMRGAAGVGIATLLLVGLLSQGRGFLAVQRDMRLSAGLSAAARSVPAPVLATDTFWLGAKLAADPPGQSLCLLRPELPANRSLFLNGLEMRGVRRFAYLGSAAGLMALAREGRARRRPYLCRKHTPTHRMALGLFEAENSTKGVAPCLTGAGVSFKMRGRDRSAPEKAAEDLHE